MAASVYCGGCVGLLRWLRRVTALYCGDCVGALPQTNQHTVVDSWQRRRCTAGSESAHCRGLLAAAAVYCGGCVGALPDANQHAVVDYSRPVWKVLALCSAPAWLVLGANLWRAGETAILSQSAVNSMQIGQAVPEAQEKPSVSFMFLKLL